MNILDILNEILQQILPLISLAVTALIAYYVCKLINFGKDRYDNDLIDRYLDMLEDTIMNCVLATTQTYVDAMKKENMFDKEAQKKAFDMTYEAVMKTLTEEAKQYIEAAVGDLNVYITNQIEATVKLTK